MLQVQSSYKFQVEFFFVDLYKGILQNRSDHQSQKSPDSWFWLRMKSIVNE